MISCVITISRVMCFLSFSFNNSSSIRFLTLSLHDALPILIVCVSCETDFVSKNDDFVAFVKSIADAAIANNVKRSEEHTSELQSQSKLVCRLLLEKKKITKKSSTSN